MFLGCILDLWSNSVWILKFLTIIWRLLLGYIIIIYLIIMISIWFLDIILGNLFKWLALFAIMRLWNWLLLKILRILLIRLWIRMDIFLWNNLFGCLLIKVLRKFFVYSDSSLFFNLLLLTFKNEIIVNILLLYQVLEIRNQHFINPQ